MSIKSQIEADIKAAMLGGDKILTSVLRGIKSAILYEEVAKSKRDNGLSDEEIISLLRKEAKKRQESADLYKQGGNNEKANSEMSEKSIIEKYLPQELDELTISALIDDVEKEYGSVSKANMGQIISGVKTKAGGGANGSTIAKLVKERMN